MSSKLAYIISAGHSGSTLLDMLIGSIPGGFSTGEFTYLPWQLFRGESSGPNASKQKLCSCGQGFHQCPAWLSVLNAVSDKVGFDVIKEPLRFNMSLMQNKKYFSRRFSMVRVHRAIYTTSSSHQLFLPISEIYGTCLSKVVRNNWLIIDNIGDKLEKRIIVDSSKSALRFKLLHGARPSDAYAFVLMRDIRGVCYSRHKLNQGITESAYGWVRQYNRIFSILQGIKGLKVLGVRYEDIAENPTTERQRIAAFLGYPEIPSDFSINTDKMHLVAGNKTRYCGDIVFRPDYSWQDNLTQETQDKIMQIREYLNPEIDQLFHSAN